MSPRGRDVQFIRSSARNSLHVIFVISIVTCACTACSPTNANPGPSMISHGLIVVPRSLRMFRRERRSNKPASAGGFRQHLESRCSARAFLASRELSRSQDAWCDARLRRIIKLIALFRPFERLIISGRLCRGHFEDADRPIGLGLNARDLESWSQAKRVSTAESVAHPSEKYLQKRVPRYLLAGWCCCFDTHSSLHFASARKARRFSDWYSTAYLRIGNSPSELTQRHQLLRSRLAGGVFRRAPADHALRPRQGCWREPIRPETMP